jgi:hypothetical protein
VFNFIENGNKLPYSISVWPECHIFLRVRG